MYTVNKKLTKADQCELLTFHHSTIHQYRCFMVGLLNKSCLLTKLGQFLQLGKGEEEGDGLLRKRNNSPC